MNDAIAITFAPAQVALEPRVVVGVRDIAHALVERLLRCTDEQLRALHGVAAPGLIAAIGASADLPWVDGALYLGRDARAPQLYLPTALTPNVPYELLERALLSAAKAMRPPLAVLAAPRGVFSLADALPIARASLQRWQKDAR